MLDRRDHLHDLLELILGRAEAEAERRRIRLLDAVAGGEDRSRRDHGAGARALPVLEHHPRRGVVAGLLSVDDGVAAPRARGFVRVPRPHGAAGAEAHRRSDQNAQRTP